MAHLTIDKIPDEVLAHLQARARENGRSVESEAAEIIRREVLPTPAEALRKLRAMVDAHFGPNKPTNVVDEFIAERRLEAQRELREG